MPFLIFLPLLVISYYLLPHRWRWLLMLAASYFFYGYWKIEYLSLIVISTTVDFLAAQYIHRNKSQVKKRIGLSVSLITNIGLLMFFKYAGWFMEDVLHPAAAIDLAQIERFKSFWNFALPVGISFYTFQTIGYTIDVYYGRSQPENNPLKFALFVSYFPQLVAGPIERFSSLHHQLFSPSKWNYQNLQHGGRQILYGLFIKMCIADNISPIVDVIFNEPSAANSTQLAFGAILFGLQIYSDFHGYSLIAIGTARLFNVKLMDNFNAPYTSISIREFWARWHISLSMWFRDYLFIPLGGSRVNQLKLALNIMIVFLVSGLWHGANWTFVIWGAMHGLAYLLERFFISKNTANWLNFPKWIATMTIVFTAWIFFRSESLAHAAGYIMSMLNNTGNGVDLTFEPIHISLIGLFILSDLHFRNRSISTWLDQKSLVIRWVVYAFLVFCIFGFAGISNHPFIYFQF
ncbi:MAG: MBOAT family O-acyltransferase [Salibacteraceae bacterium]